MNLNKKNLVLTAFTLIIIGITVWRALQPTAADAGKSGFSADQAIKDIETIAKEPHSSENQQALQKVRTYLCSRFESMGLKPTVNTYTANNWLGSYAVNNITAQIDGRNNHPYVLVMAHYDSVLEDLYGERSESTGAVDDGYGVAVLLQIAEYFSKTEKQPVNGIKFLLTDSEETGPLEGSKAEISQNTDYYEDVSLIINIEARGANGPAMMFHTSGGNSRVIELYSKANSPFSNSLMTGLFRFMPNITDLNPFLEHGYPGLDFAALGHLKYYHSGYDRIEAIDADTLSHYGEQIFPLMKEYVYQNAYSDPHYFKTGKNAVFFSLPPNIFIYYYDAVNSFLFIITILLLFFIIIKGRRKGTLFLKVCIRYGLKWLMFTLIAAISALILTVFLAFLTGSAYNPIFMISIPYDNAVFIVYILLVLAGAVIWTFRCRRNTDSLPEMLIGGLQLNLIYYILFTLFLKGGSYLFLLPSLFASAAIALLMHGKSIAVKPMLLLTLSFMILIYAPVIYVLYYALTIGSLFLPVILLSAGMSVFAPALLFIIRKQKADCF